MFMHNAIVGLLEYVNNIYWSICCERNLGVAVGYGLLLNSAPSLPHPVYWGASLYEREIFKMVVVNVSMHTML